MTKHQPTRPIVIIGPMESESKSLIAALKKPSEYAVGAYRYIEGAIDGYPVVVCRCYIGVVNSAAATALAIQHYDPLCVILQGTSGAHDPALHQGDIVLGEDIVELGSFYTRHRDVGQGSAVFDWTQPGAEILSGKSVVRVNVLHSDSRIMDVANTVPYAEGRVIRGVIGAADIWNRELDMIAHLHRTLGTACEEMEGFGVAQVCAQTGVPMADIRVISNSEWHEQEEFNENLGELCQMFVLQVVSRLIAENTLM